MTTPADDHPDRTPDRTDHKADDDTTTDVPAHLRNQGIEGGTPITEIKTTGEYL